MPLPLRRNDYLLPDRSAARTDRGQCFGVGRGLRARADHARRRNIDRGQFVLRSGRGEGSRSGVMAEASSLPLGKPRLSVTSAIGIGQILAWGSSYYLPAVLSG